MTKFSRNSEPLATHSNSSLIGSFQSVSRIAGVAVITVGCLVLVGWQFNITALKSILPGLATMKVNTALAFVLSGLSLLLLWTEQTGHSRPLARHIALACTVLVALLGLFTFSQDLFGWDLGIDQLLFKDSAGSVGTAHPGRMSEITAFNLLMIGCALLLLNTNKQNGARNAHLFAIVAGLSALLALVGYVYSVQALYRLGPFSSIALPTALTFLVLALAILCLQPDRGLMVMITKDTAGGTMMRRLLPAAIAIPFVLGWLSRLGEQAGLYDARFSVALLALASIIVFTILIGSNARALDRAALGRQRAEAALQQSEERFATMFRSSPTPIALTRLADGKIMDVNEAFCQLFGYTNEEVVGHTSLELGIVDREARQKRVELVKKTGLIRDSEIRARNRNGHPLDLLTSIESIRLNEDAYALTTMIDITERKQAEETLARQAAELRRSNAELEQFAYVASHDLQEPLRIVSSYVQLLARRYRGQLDSEADEFIAFAVEGANQMKTLINDLLAFSRVGTRGKDFVPVAMDEVFDRAVSNMQLAIEESGAAVTHDPLPQVMADDVQMTQVLQNLVGNAIKFRSQEPPRVYIGARQQGEHWLFFVRDNGIGLDPKYAERIFIIFQRLHSRDEYSGTGIGLAICRKIIERHGGRIWVESEPGKGSTFYFTLHSVERVKPEAEAARPEGAKPRARDSVAERATDLV